MLPTGALLRFRPPPLIYDVAADHVNAIRIKRDGPGVSRFIPFFRIYERGVMIVLAAFRRFTSSLQSAAAEATAPGMVRACAAVLLVALVCAESCRCSVKFVHVSDIHLDPTYEPCSRPEDSVCHGKKHDKCYPLGQYGCNLYAVDPLRSLVVSRR
jgi:hypothetical protein